MKSVLMIACVVLMILTPMSTPKSQVNTPSCVVLSVEQVTDRVGEPLWMFEIETRDGQRWKVGQHESDVIKICEYGNWFIARVIGGQLEWQ